MYVCHKWVDINQNITNFSVQVGGTVISRSLFHVFAFPKLSVIKYISCIIKQTINITKIQVQK